MDLSPHVERWNLKVLMPGSVLGVAGAGLFVGYVSNAAIELTVGVIGLAFVLYSRLMPWLRPNLTATDKPKRPPAPLGVIYGALSGFMSTLIQVGAPPYQIHILPQRLDKLSLVGTTVIFFAFMNLMKIVPYFALGQFSPRNLGTSFTLLPIAIAANFLGIWLVRKTPTELFYRVTYLLMFAISLTLIWQGWRGI